MNSANFIETTHSQNTGIASLNSCVQKNTSMLSVQMANAILNRVREGGHVPECVIVQALKATGDLHDKFANT